MLTLRHILLEKNQHPKQNELDLLAQSNPARFAYLRHSLLFDQ